ncbi:leucyl aminopeptidase [Achromobacter sp. F4_2707]|uniref:leucyl aminopeptidase n=1 Tax=Achromobacter sp. F4_2707 TaxID=3114286 RepID=UPI0039C66299
MEFSTQTTTGLQQVRTAALGVGVFTDGILTPPAEILDRASEGAISAVLKSEFKGKANTHLVLRNLPGVKAERIIVIGLGKQEAYKAATHAAAEQTFAGLCASLNVTEGVSTLAGVECENTSLRSRASAMATAALRSQYRYEATRTKDIEPAPRLKKLAVWVSRSKADEVKEGLKEGTAIGNGVNLARELGDLPPNICTPTYLGDTAKKLGKEFKSLKVEVLDRKKIEAEKMGAFLSVANGSDEPPVFIVMRHTPKGGKSKDKAPLVLVGKGLTFDSGGISIKPAASMDEMKYDMCGAASVLGTMRAVAELELDREVIGLVASCENMPSGRANKPGDVVTSMSGQTIEILNTDAEGRLVLCDALTYAERFKPEAVIDIATLTGACVVALGHVNSGLFSKDDKLAEDLLEAGRNAGDTAWRMPLEDAYQEQLRSNFADMANIGGMPAGSVTAACFLARYTSAYSWAHLDIAGTAWKSGKEKGATGRPVPLLTHFLLSRS